MGDIIYRNYSVYSIYSTYRFYTINKINADIMETGTMGILDSLEGLPGGVAAAYQSQNIVIQTLDTKADTIEQPKLLQTIKICRGKVLRVALDGNLLNLREVEIASQPVDNSGHLIKWQQRRCSSTEINSLYRMCLFFTTMFHLYQQSIYIVMHKSLRCNRIEGAVGALAVTERDMQVDHSRARSWSAAA